MVYTPFMIETAKRRLDTAATLIGEIVQCKRSEEALRESEELHRITLGNISDAVFITDDSGAFTYICPNVKVIFGYAYEEVQALGNIARLLGENLFDPRKLEVDREIHNIEREVCTKAGGVHTV